MISCVIDDPAIIALLRQEGFSCEPDTSPSIMNPTGIWWETDAPIGAHRSEVRLSDGTVLIRVGTALIRKEEFAQWKARVMQTGQAKASQSRSAK